MPGWVGRLLKIEMYSQLLRCITARGSSAGYSRVSPTEVEACKSFLLTLIINLFVYALHPIL